jgi:hypothetical protein
MFIEVALITMQKWRGTASHFNNATAFDAIIFSLMGLLIMIVAIVILIVTVYSFRGLNAKPEMAFAIRSGLILLNIGNLLGIILIIYGNYVLQTNPGHPPNIYGQSGIMKFPHAVALHAIQVLPVLAWLLSLTKRDTVSRLRILKVALVGYCGLLIFALLQTFSGHAPLDVTVISAAISLVSAGLLAFAFFMAFTEQSDGGARIQSQEVT